MDQANEVLQDFLTRFNARFAVAAEQPATASGLASSHLEEDRQKLLADLESSVEKRAKAGALA